MTKREYLSKLSVELFDLSSDEREEAIAYYREYIEDAGPENEEATIKELGPVEELAKEIRRGILNKEIPQELETQLVVKSEASKSKEKKENNTVAIILGIILAIVLSPIWIPLLVVVLAVLFALIVTMAAIIFAIGVVGAVFTIVGFILIFVSFATVFASPLHGFAMFGTALILAALGILFLLLISWGGTKFFPWMMNGISNLVKKMFGLNN